MTPISLASVAPDATPERPAPKGVLRPTDEQQAAIDAKRTGDAMVLEAGAGTGKTSTLRLMAQACPSERGVYIAYNRAIADDAKGSFPKSVTCATAHSFAFREVGRRYKDRLSGPRIPSYAVADILGCERVEIGEHRVLRRNSVARTALDTVRNFCNSADAEIGPKHVPFVEGLDPRYMLDFRNQVALHAAAAWHDLQGTTGRLRFEHDCQPAGTLVRRVVSAGGNFGSAFEDVPIEQIREGDRVVSLSMNQRRGYVRRSGRVVTAAGSRPFVGELVTVTTPSGRSSSYTPEHRCVVRLDCALAEGNHIVYLARRGNNFRIGRTTWRTTSQSNALGLRRRAESQDADAMWILSVHATDADAALDEALIAHRWALPTWQFRSKNEVMPLARFWEIVGNNGSRAMGCLDDHDLNIEFPFWQRGDGWGNTRRPVVLRALNLLPGMLVLEPDQMTPCGHGELRAYEGSGGWSPIAIGHTYYDGQVYNLDVEKDHTYIADGIATHNCYLKMWALGGPTLPGDFILLDEAQDANPVIAGVVLAQQAQLVAVGDAQQAIYGWRGAVDAMRDWPAEIRLPLAQSFRFGPAIAEEANVWLGRLQSSLRLRGFDRIDSQVTLLQEPKAILCRTNAQAVAEAMTAMDDGLRVAIVGGVQQIRGMARAASDLKDGAGTDHPELCAFKSWAEVQEYVEEEETAAADLRVLVGLVDRYGVGGIFRVTDAVVEERDADLIVSTAHKSKGREFESVLVARDFSPPKDADSRELDASEVRLMYVAVTRAKRLLDCSALDWARDWSVAL